MVSRRVLFEVRHVSPEFSAAGACVLCELSQRPGGSPEFLSLLVRATVGGGLVCSSIDDLSFPRMIDRHVWPESVSVDRLEHHLLLLLCHSDATPVQLRITKSVLTCNF